MKALPFALGAALVTGALAVATVAPRLARLPGLEAPAHVASAQPQKWLMVARFHGDAFVIDRSLSHDDCDDSKPRDQGAKSLYFVCELES